MVNANSVDRYIVGAYATSPNLFTWNEDTELNYFNGLKKLQSIRGLELPFWGDSLHPFNTQWLLSNLDPKWENVLTCVPGTMKRLESDSCFGLASKKEKSRNEAIKFYLKAFKYINQLKSQFGQKSVAAIYITSSPFINHHHVYGDKENFFLSLCELATWDWGNTKLLIEHCDTYNSKNPNPKKGFLSLVDEIDVIKQTNEKHGTSFGVVINWGRSAIEYRNVNGPIQHIKYAAENNVLGGIMFSGTTTNDNNLYGAWSDLHMPPAPFADYQYFEPESLMTFENIKNTLSTCDSITLDCLGLKLLAMPDNSTIEKRISINKDAMELLDQAINELISL